MKPTLSALPFLLLAFLTGTLPVAALEEFYSVSDAAHGTPASTWASTLAANGYSYRTYESFTLTSDALITQVTWTGVYIDENPGASAPPPAQTTAWRIGFFTNAAGQPGTQVHSVDIPAANVTSVFVSDEVWENGNPLERRRYTANLPTPAVLASGATYWFSPVSLQPAYNPHFSWWMGTESGDCFQHLTQPPTDFTRPNNRAFTLRGEFPSGISLTAGGTTIPSGGTHNFGAAVELGQETSATFTITNTGAGPLTGIAVSIAPPGSSDFRVGSPPSATTLAAGATDTFSVIFSPQAVGARTATLNVVSSAAPNPHVIQLSGTGNIPPVLTTPAEDYYGECGQGETDIAAFLASHGGATVEDGGGPVTWTHDYGGTLPECRSYITVTFTATDAGGSSVSTSARFFLLPPSAIWTGSATGTWPTAAAWSRFPSAVLDTYVDLFDFQDSVVTINPGSSPSVKDLYIGRGDTLAIGSGTSGGTLEVYGNSISNGGTIRISTHISGSGVSFLYINGTTTLTGTGRVILTGAGRNRIERGTNSAADVLTVAAGQEVTATGGTVAEYQHTSIHAGLINHGLITADGSGLTLYSNPKTNNATFRAINGGTLRMEAAIDNANGTLFTGPGSTLHLETTLTGGQVTGGGRLLINSTAALIGPITLGSGLTTTAESSITDLNGPITNNGILRLGMPGGGSLANLNVNGAVTLQGNGKLVIQGSGRRLIERGNSSTADVLTVAAGQEITTSAGTVAGSQSTGLKAGLVNDGIITADQGGIALTHNAKTNNGTFRAINAGSLIITGSTLTNYAAATGTLTGGRWEVVSDGTATLMDIQSSPIVALAAGTTVRLSGAGASLPQLSTLTNISGTLAPENGKTLATSGNMVVPGKLHYGLPAAQDTTRLNITGNVDFTGGTVDIADLGMNSGSYILATWTGSVTGAPVLGVRPSGMTQSLVVDTAAKQLRLEVFVIPQVEIRTFTIVPGNGANAGQNVVTLGGTGHPNAGYILQATTDLQTRTPISGVLTSPTGTISWQFTESPGFTRRCYRFLPQ